MLALVSEYGYRRMSVKLREAGEDRGAMDSAAGATETAAKAEPQDGCGAVV
jgi:hypothetical protein